MAFELINTDTAALETVDDTDVVTLLEGVVPTSVDGAMQGNPGGDTKLSSVTVNVLGTIVAEDDRNNFFTGIATVVPPPSLSGSMVPSLRPLRASSCQRHPTWSSKTLVSSRTMSA